MKTQNDKKQPPIAKIIPTELEKFGDVRVDNYFWLKDRENPEVIDLHRKMIIMKNDCSHAWISKELFEEMKARIKENDESVYLYNAYYITRFETGKDYPIYSRKKRPFSKRRDYVDAMN
jgi:oligopeptidase B